MLCLTPPRSTSPTSSKFGSGPRESNPVSDGYEPSMVYVSVSTRPLSDSKNWMPELVSNQRFELQRLTSYPLDDPASSSLWTLHKTTSRVSTRSLFQQLSDFFVCHHCFCFPVSRQLTFHESIHGGHRFIRAILYGHFTKFSQLLRVFF